MTCAILLCLLIPEGHPVRIEGNESLFQYVMDATSAYSLLYPSGKAQVLFEEFIPPEVRGEDPFAASRPKESPTYSYHATLIWSGDNVLVQNCEGWWEPNPRDQSVRALRNAELVANYSPKHKHCHLAPIGQDTSAAQHMFRLTPEKSWFGFQPYSGMWKSVFFRETEDENYYADYRHVVSEENAIVSVTTFFPGDRKSVVRFDRSMYMVPLDSTTTFSGEVFFSQTWRWKNLEDGKPLLIESVMKSSPPHDSSIVRMQRLKVEEFDPRFPVTRDTFTLSALKMDGGTTVEDTLTNRNYTWGKAAPPNDALFDKLADEVRNKGFAKPRNAAQ